MNLRNNIRVAITLFLLCPFLILIFQFKPDVSIDWLEFKWALSNSFIQASLSAVFSLILGAWGGLGLIVFSEGSRRHWRALLEIMCLIPNFIPPVFILLSALSFIDPFPMGIEGIVIIHVLINFGLVAVSVASLIETKLGGIAELCAVEGVGAIRFYRSILLPLLWRDFMLLFLFVFSVCFSSFSIPMIVGGSYGTTLEVLIYEKIKLSTDWGQAVTLGMLQSLFLFSISLVALRGRVQLQERQAHFSLISSRSGVFLVISVFCMIMLGYGQGVLEGLPQLSGFFEFKSAILWGIFGSLVLSLIAASFLYIMLLAIAMAWPEKWFEKFLTGYLGPSTSLTCFTLLLLTPNESFWPFLKIPLAMVLICLPILYRMGWGAEIEGLRRQYEVAISLGAKPWELLRLILLPQLSKRAAFFSAIIAVWTCGDFAISRVLAHHDLSIAMMVQTLMSTYRLGMASVLSLLLLFLCLVSFLFILGVGRVLSRKFAS